MQSSKTRAGDQIDERVASRVSGTVVAMLLVVVTLVAAALRLYKLGAWSFWVDELFTLKDSLDPGRLYHGMSYPLSYMLIGASMHSLGVSEWSARIVPALFGIATPVMVYLLARRSFGEVPSIIGAAIIAVSPWHLYWSQMARFYTMTVFFSTASLLVLYRGLEENRKSYAAAAGILMSLSVLSHYSALLTFSAALVYLVLIRLLRWTKPQGFNVTNWMIFLAPFMLGAVVLGAKVAAFLGVYAGGHPTGTSIANPVAGGAYMIASIAYRLEFGVALLAVVGAFIGLKRRDRGTLILACGVVVPALLLVIAGAMSHAENRYAFVVLPPAALLSGTALSRVWELLREKSRVLAVALPLVVMLPMIQHDISYFSSVYNGERWNYRAAADYLRAHAKPGDIVYSSMPFSLDYYLKGTGIVVQDLNVGKDASGLPKSRSWLVMEDATRGSSVSQKLGRWIRTNCKLQDHFSASSPAADYGLSVYRRLPSE